MTTPIAPSTELRALWVIRYELADRDAIDQVIDIAQRGRFQLLFVQVRGRGDAYYRSPYEPPGLSLKQPPSVFDPLAYLLARAHEAGIAVHAWVNVYYVWSDDGSEPPAGHIVREHPEWLLTDDRGERMDRFPVDHWTDNGLEGYFVSPANRAAREHTVAVIEDLAQRYEIDGVHLDYVRYPGMGFGYSKAERTHFALEYGADPAELRRDRERIADIIGDEGVGSLDELLIEWRTQQVDSLVMGVRRAIAPMPLSAAVIPDHVRARDEKGQDWVYWLQHGLVDFVVLMAYSYRPDELQREITYLNNVVGLDRLVVGLPLFDGRARYLEPSVALLRQEGIKGFSLFSYRQLANNPFSLGFLESVFLAPADSLQ